MSAMHAAALGEALGMYLLLAAACAGWGRIAMPLLGAAPLPPAWLALRPWVGWAVLLWLFQLAHLVVPLAAPWVLAILAPGVACGIACGVREIRGVRAPASGITRAIGLLALLCLAWLVAERSMLRPPLFDAGLYYLSSMRWTIEHALVPGLGNLHSRLAYNQSGFVWAAALSLHPWLGHGRSIANAFLLLLTVLTLARVVAGATGPDREARDTAPMRLAAVLAAPVLLLPILSLDAVTAPTPDTSLLLLQLVVLVCFVGVLAGWQRDTGPAIAPAGVTILLASTLLTLKLSGGAFGGAVALVCALGMLHGRGYRAAIRVCAPAALLVALWALRGYVLSGAPFFPATVARIPFDWAVPVERMREETRWIYSWARAPGLDWRLVLGSDAWFEPWLARLRSNTILVQPLVAGVVCLALSVPLALRDARRPHPLWLAPVPAVAALAFWYLTAPDPRFALGAFWALGVAGALVFLHYLRASVRPAVYAPAAVVVFLLLQQPLLVTSVESASLLRMRSSQGWQAVPAPRLDARSTRAGVVVSVPRGDQRCWDAPLPCTPLFDPALAWRDLGNPGAGFRTGPVTE